MPQPELPARLERILGAPQNTRLEVEKLGTLPENYDLVIQEKLTDARAAVEIAIRLVSGRGARVAGR